MKGYGVVGPSGPTAPFGPGPAPAASFDSGDYPSLLADYDAAIEVYKANDFSVLCTANGDTVGGWKDQNANANPLSYLDATEPIYNTGSVTGPNLKPFVNGNGAGKLQRASGTTWGDDGTAYFVIKQNSWTVTDVIMGGNTAATGTRNIAQTLNSPEIRLISQATPDSVPVNADLAIGVWGVLTVVYTGGAGSLTRINLGTRQTGDCGAPSDAAFNGWCLFNQRNTLLPSDVSIARLVLYSATHSESNQDAVIALLMSMYGIA